MVGGVLFFFDCEGGGDGESQKHDRIATACLFSARKHVGDKTSHDQTFLREIREEEKKKNPRRAGGRGDSSGGEMKSEKRE